MHGPAVSFAIAVLLAATLTFQAVAQDHPPPPSVVVAEVVSKDITPHFSYVGRAEAVDSVELRTRVEGFLQARNFEEGSDVKQGQVLFEIERTPYEAVVA